MLGVMQFLAAADAASVEVRPVSGEFLISHLTLFAVFIVFTAFAAFALVCLSRKTGTGDTRANSSPQAPASLVTPAGPRRSTRRWMIAGVVVAVLSALIAAAELAHGW